MEGTIREAVEEVIAGPTSRDHLEAQEAAKAEAQEVGVDLSEDLVAAWRAIAEHAENITAIAEQTTELARLCRVKFEELNERVDELERGE